MSHVKIFEVTQIGLFQKKTNQGERRGLKTYFFEKHPGISRFLTSPCKFQQNKASFLEIPHYFFVFNEPLSSFACYFFDDTRNSISSVLPSPCLFYSRIAHFQKTQSNIDDGKHLLIKE